MKERLGCKRRQTEAAAPEALCSSAVPLNSSSKIYDGVLRFALVWIE